jgi:maleylpyruvate isomerase
MKLYAYYQSSASYRVRIALNLKGLAPEIIPINLVKGEQKTDSYRTINPQGLVPSLVDGEHALTQSLAIIEYLEEKYPAPALLPLTPPERARVRAIAQAMACEMAPLGNLRVRKFIQKEFSASEKDWTRHWNELGLAEVEAMLTSSSDTGKFCHGASPTMADCILVPQLFVARRFGCDVSAYPTLARIDAACAEIPAFIAAHPSKQPDAQ